MPPLRRSQPAGPGFARVPNKDGFDYLDPHGAPVTDPDAIARFDALVLPPAWTDVWLCPYPNGHIQATGVDAAGRRQYHYHPAWRARMDAIKFDRALQLAATLPTARVAVRRALDQEEFTRERALAAAFRMLDVASLRVGTEKYAKEHGSFGLASLLWQHATVAGDTVTLDFPAKSHHHWRSDVSDADLAAYVAERRRHAHEITGGLEHDDDAVEAHRAAIATLPPTALPPDTQAAPAPAAPADTQAPPAAPPDPAAIIAAELRLLAFRSNESWHALAPHDINDHVRELTGDHFSAKDFRTLHGTIAAADHLARAGHAPSEAKRNRIVAAAMRAAAATLNNTPAVAKASYVDPRVVDHYHHGRTIDPTASPEAELLRLIGHQVASTDGAPGPAAPAGG